MLARILGAALSGSVGILSIVFGWLIWKKEKLSLLNDGHTDRLSPENRQAYCRLAGIGLIVAGVSLVITGVILGITDSAYSFLCFAAGGPAGLALLITAGAKYNR